MCKHAVTDINSGSGHLSHHLPDLFSPICYHIPGQWSLRFVLFFNVVVVFFLDDKNEEWAKDI